MRSLVKASGSGVAAMAVVAVVAAVVVGPRARFAGGGSVVVVLLGVSLVAIAVVCSVGRGLSLIFIAKNLPICAKSGAY